MILALDVGNTRIKWGVFDRDGRLLTHGASGNGDMSVLAGCMAQWRRCERVMVSNVAGAAVEEALRELLEPLALPVSRVEATAQCCGIRNGYAQHGQLGSDRWAALIAARHRVKEAPCVVVLAGTALTVDALAGTGEFLGGLILPGLHTMRHGLARSASALRVEPRGHWRDYPSGTPDAMHTGALEAAAGAIERMQSRLATREALLPYCLLGGGDAEQIAPLLCGPVEVVEPLVLEGLYWMAQGGVSAETISRD